MKQIKLKKNFGQGSLCPNFIILFYNLLFLLWKQNSKDLSVVVNIHPILVNVGTLNFFVNFFIVKVMNEKDFIYKSYS